MRIQRRYTAEGRSPYSGIAMAKRTSEIRNPDGSIVFRLENIEVPEHWSQVATDVLAQKYFRKAGVPTRLKRVEEETVPSWLWRGAADERALETIPEKQRYGGEMSATQVFDRLAGTWTYWGWKGGYFEIESDAQAFYRRAPLHAGDADGGAQLAAMVQHRPALGLWHRRPEPGTFLRRLPERQADQGRFVLRASAAARLLHPVDRGRSGQRKRDHGPVGARGPPVQIRLGHRLEFLQAARRERKAFRRRALVGPDELPQDRRPRRGRDQVGRHHAPRRQDGGGRRRSPRYRKLHRLEGARGAEGRLAGGGLQDLRQAPEGRDEVLRQLRGRRRRLLRPGEEPGAQARDQVRAARLGARQLHQARDPVRQAGLQGHQLPDLRRGLGRRGVSDRVGPELQQFRARHRRIPARGRGRRQLGPHLPQERQDGENREGARAVGEDRLCGLGLRRSRHAVPHHGQRLAHLPGLGADPRLQPVLGIHVPRRHGVQSRLAESAAVPRQGEALRRRELRARLPAVDHRARNLGADGAVPLQEHRRAFLQLPHARAGLRQYRRAADVVGHRLRFRRCARDLRRHHGADDRRLVRDLGRNGARARQPSRASSRTASTCCA